jgi:hypothetical protein
MLLADLTRDNGFNATVEVKPVKHLDLEADFTYLYSPFRSTFNC